MNNTVQDPKKEGSLLILCKVHLFSKKSKTAKKLWNKVENPDEKSRFTLFSEKNNVHNFRKKKFTSTL